MSVLDAYVLMTMDDHAEVQRLGELSRLSWQAAERTDFAAAEGHGEEYRRRHEALFQLLFKRSCKKTEKVKSGYIPYGGFSRPDRHDLFYMTGEPEAFKLSRVLHAAKMEARG